MNPTPWTQRKWIRISLLVLLIALSTLWLLEVPSGLTGKMDAVGFAVCHQIESHTIEIGGKLLPLCARCTGMYLGFLVALLYLSNRQKPAGIPSRLKIAFLAFFFLLFVVDGVNSMLTTFLKIEPLYTPTNWLRLATGLAMGAILANLILPLWNQTLWKENNPAPALRTWKQMGALFLCEIVIGVLVWLDIPLLYYPVAILSTGSIFLVLGMVYSLLWSIILNKENTLGTTRDGWTFFVLGAIFALLQIGLMDLLRVSLMGSWSGFPL